MFLNKTLFFLIFMNSPLVFASSACNESKWLVEEKIERFCYNSQFSTWMSESCLNKNCGAQVFLKKAKIITGEDFRNYGSQNPGSKFCQHFQGKVLIGRNERGSENAFCQAKDGSMVSLSALGRK